MNFSYLWNWFEYCLKESAHPKRNFEINPHSTFFIDGAAQSYVDADTVPTDFPPSSHLTTPPLPSDDEEHNHTPLPPSHSSNITSLNFHADLVESFEFSYAFFSLTSFFTFRCSSG